MIFLSVFESAFDGRRDPDPHKKYRPGFFKTVKNVKSANLPVHIIKLIIYLCLQGLNA